MNRENFGKTLKLALEISEKFTVDAVELDDNKIGIERDSLGECIIGKEGNIEGAINELKNKGWKISEKIEGMTIMIL